MFLQILKAFAADDTVFVQNCGRLMALNNDIKTMSHFEFRNICDTKLERIGQRISCYQEVPAPRGPSLGYSGCQCHNPAHLRLSEQEHLLVCVTYGKVRS